MLSITQFAGNQCIVNNSLAIKRTIYCNIFSVFVHFLQYMWGFYILIFLSACVSNTYV